jgi:ParB-like nuclease domain
MFSSDKGKQKKRRSVETNVSNSSAEEPVYQEGYRSKPGRSHSNLLNVPLHSPGSVQNASVNHETAETPDYQNTSYTDKLSIAIRMVPDLLVGDVKETLEKLLHDPAFTAELVAVGAVFVGLQATPAGPFIDAAMVATLGVDVALKLGGFLYKSYTAHNEDDLKEAAEDLKGFVEVAGLVGATKLLGMAGRTLKKLSGEATAVEGQTVPHGELRDVSGKELDNIRGRGLGEAPQPNLSQVPVKELYGRQPNREYNRTNIKRIKKSMKHEGFDPDNPIRIAEVNGRKIIIDGHHRSRAAGAAGIKKVPVIIEKLSKKEASLLEQEAAEASQSLQLEYRWNNPYAPKP